MLLMRDGRCVARSLGVVCGVFGPQGFLLLWDAWTCLLDFSLGHSSWLSFGFPISLQLLAQEYQDLGGFEGERLPCAERTSTNH